MTPAPRATPAFCPNSPIPGRLAKGVRVTGTTGKHQPNDSQVEAGRALRTDPGHRTGWATCLQTKKVYHTCSSGAAAGGAYRPPPVCRKQGSEPKNNPAVLGGNRGGLLRPTSSL